MIKKWTTAVVSLLAISASVQAQEVQTSDDLGLNVEAFGGMRWGNVDFDKGTEKKEGNEKFFRAQEFKVGANYQIPNIPVAAGLNLGFVNYNNKETFFDAKQAYAIDTTVEAKAWVPAELLPTLDMVVPYVRVAYTPYSWYRQETETQAAVQKLEGDNNGYSVGGGVNVKIAGNMSGAVEYAYSERTLTTENTDTKERSQNRTLASHGVLVGVTAHM